MLSISNVTPGQGVSYFKQENYYSQAEALEHSEWLGKGAAKLGLDGPVEGEDFKNLLHGKSPDGKKTLSGKKINLKNHRAGFDLTFSAPKSASLIALMGEDKQMEQAHRTAVKRTLEIFEQQYAQARVWDGEQQQHVNTGNIVAALFHHTTSREKDPQIHTHCVVLNCTQLENGKWRALTNEEIYHNKMLLGAIYRNELAYEARQLGYESEPRLDELFEIKGYTQEQLDWFSKRRQQILELVGPDATAVQKAWATLQTRAKKGKELPHQELLGWWQAQDEAMNLQIKHPTPSPLRLPVEERAHQATTAVRDAIEHCSERTVAFKRKALEKFIFSEIKNFSYAELEQAIANDSELIKTVDQRFTTQSALQRENETIELMAAGKGQVAAIVHPKIIDRYLSGKRLTQGQRGAIALAAVTEDQFIAWQGVAGAGKTYALQEFKLLAEAQGYIIKGYAPSTDATKVLAEELGIEANTVAHLILAKQPAPPQAQQIWVVDEAGLLSAKDAKALLKRATAEQARVILVGDTRQMSAVEAGAPFRSLQEHGIQTAYLNQSLRQKVQDLKEAADLVADGKIVEGIERLEVGHPVSGSRIEILPAPDERAARITADFMKLTPVEREKTLILTGTNAERLAITAQLRAALKSEGTLGYGVDAVKLKSKDLTLVQGRYAHYYEVGNVVVPTRKYKGLGLQSFQPYVVEAVEQDRLTLSDRSGNTLTVDPMQFRKDVYARESIEVAVGDRLRWTKKDKELGHSNGQEFTVVAIDGSTATVAYKNGDTEDIDLNLPLHLDYALVSTTYSSQGKTASRVLISTANNRTANRETFYVAISRVQHELKIYAESREALLTKVQQSGRKENPRDLVHSSGVVKTKPATAVVEPPVPVAQPSAFVESAFQQVPSESRQGSETDSQMPSENFNQPQENKYERSDASQSQSFIGADLGRRISQRLNSNSRTTRPNRGLGNGATTINAGAIESRPSTTERRNPQPAANQQPESIRRFDPIGGAPGATGARAQSGSGDAQSAVAGSAPGFTELRNLARGVEQADRPQRRVGATSQRLEPAITTTERSPIQSRADAQPIQSGFTTVSQQLDTELTTPSSTVRDFGESDRQLGERSGTVESVSSAFDAAIEQPAIQLQHFDQNTSDIIRRVERANGAERTMAARPKPTLKKPERRHDSTAHFLNQDTRTLTQRNSLHRRRPEPAHRQAGRRTIPPVERIGRTSRQFERVRENFAALTAQLKNLPLSEVAQRLGLIHNQRQRVWTADGFKIGINEEKGLFNDLKNPGMNGIKGGGAVNLTMYVLGKDFKQARDWLAKEFRMSSSTSYVPQLPPRPLKQIPAVEPERRPFVPPVPDESRWAEVRDYLTCQRGLPAPLVDRLHAQGRIYASGANVTALEKLRAQGYDGDKINNLVSLRRDDNGVPTGAALRGISDRHGFKGLAENSRRNEGYFSFTQGERDLKQVVVTEAAIDALSAAALKARNTPNQSSESTMFVATDGSGATPLQLMQQTLERGGQVVLAQDADLAGETQAWKMLQALSSGNVTRRTPKVGKDLNDELRATLTHQTQQWVDLDKWSVIAQALGKSENYIEQVKAAQTLVESGGNLSQPAQSAMAKDFEQWRETNATLWKWHQVARNLSKSETYQQRIAEIAVNFNHERQPVPIPKEAVIAMQEALSESEPGQLKTVVSMDVKASIASSQTQRPLPASELERLQQVSSSRQEQVSSFAKLAVESALKVLDAMKSDAYASNKYRLARLGETVIIVARDGRGEIARSTNGVVTGTASLSDASAIDLISKSMQSEQVQKQQLRRSQGMELED